MKNYINAIPSVRVPEIWPRIECELPKVLDRRYCGYTVEDVYSELMQNRMQLWVINDFDAIVVTSVQIYPTQKSVLVPFLVGENSDKWLGDLHNTLVEYGKYNGCDIIEFQGRRGWRKKHKDFPEYRELYTTFIFDMREGE